MAEQFGATISANTSPFDQAIKNSAKNADSLSSSIKGVTEKTKETTEAFEIFKGLSAEKIFEKIIDSARELAATMLENASAAEQFKLRLSFMIGSQQQAAELFEKMSDLAIKSGQKIDDVIGAATQLTGAFRGNVEEVNKLMPVIADLAAVSRVS